MKKKENTEAPFFDQQLADSYVGKYLLIGLTYVDKYGKELKTEQLHGTIAHANSDGIEVDLKGTNKGKTYCLPPDLRSFHKTKKGTYTLKNTNEVVENPDFTSNWIITRDKSK